MRGAGAGRRSGRGRGLPFRRGWLLLLLGGVVPGAVTGQVAKRFRSDYDEYFRKYTKHYFGVGRDWRWFKAPPHRAGRGRRD